MKRMMLVLASFGLALNVFASEKTSTGFYWPTKTDQLGNYAGWLGNEWALENLIFQISHDTKRKVHLTDCV